MTKVKWLIDAKVNTEIGQNNQRVFFYPGAVVEYEGFDDYVHRVVEWEWAEYLEPPPEPNQSKQPKQQKPKTPKKQEDSND